MNLFEVLHERWAADATLDNSGEGILPASRVFTGQSLAAFDSDRLPFAVMDKGSGRPIMQSSADSGTPCNEAVDSIGVLIQIFHENWDAGEAIMNAVKSLYNRTNFDLAGTDKVLTMERDDDSHFQENDGTWRFLISFRVLVYLPAGV